MSIKRPNFLASEGYEPSPETGVGLATLTSPLALLCALVAVPQAAFASESRPPLCVDASVPRSAISERNGRWIELTSEQWQFLRGVYVMNPTMPPGLPYGDHAVLAQLADDTQGVVFFIDGDKACTPMSAPSELLVMMRDVATNKINHERGGL
jgi:hypothetical protein